MGKKKINYYKEKRWIMAWWYKRRKELKFTDADMFSQWNKWWKSDFTDSADEAFRSKEDLPCKKNAHRKQAL